ncbi:MAG TPA: cupin domain-containing protein, partial [Thermoleophilaceae bacterium]|nr:cupin domain-containing protein [Thermoleophilaceae bacterium]
MAEPRYVLAEHDLEARGDAGESALVRVTFGRASGSEALEQRVVRVAPGGSVRRGPDEREEALFVLRGDGRLVIDGVAHDLVPETAAYVASGETSVVENTGSGELSLVSVLLPPAPTPPADRAVTVRLSDQEARDATSDREFRILLEPSTGLTGATQFVGYIPTKRAPEHYHLYDEVIYVLDGQGVLHVGDEHTPIGAGSCIHLRPELRHCLENTGTSEMRVLGVFRPAGDPSEA